MVSIGFYGGSMVISWAFHRHSMGFHGVSYLLGFTIILMAGLRGCTVMGNEWELSGGSMGMMWHDGIKG